MPRPARISIDTDALRLNLEQVNRCAPNAKVVACVKANAYGHGAVAVAKALDNKVDLFGVACLQEAQELEAAGVRKRCLLLEGCFDEHEWLEAARLGCAAVIHSTTQLEQFLHSKVEPAMSVWLKIDTGMHRLGVDLREVSNCLDKLRSCSHCMDIQLMSHFACAEEKFSADTAEQLQRFSDISQPHSLPRSLANSAAILALPESHLDWVRPGFMLYGNSPFENESPQDRQLLAAMQFESEIIATRTIAAGEGVGYNKTWRAERETRIAVVAAGYGDGYPRTARNGTPILVDGAQAPLIGTVSMDLLTIDVSHLPAATIGSKVELWGKNLAASTVASFSDMSPYELFTRIPPRVRREYISSAR